MSIKKIKPAEWIFLPVYIWLFAVALSFSENKLNIETIFLIILLFIFWLKLEATSYFNPFWLFIGFHYYEVESSNNIVFILITKEKGLKHGKELNNLIRINDFTFLKK